ncbi:hypothetical protein CU048_10865 [Beijerinckiaceae bacterium]|nr:hypothetical protein CU048_10865 [Beijerinckiaceae bacterium]
MYRRLLDQHEDLLKYLENQENRPEKGTPQQKLVEPPSVEEDDLSDLPDELLAQLSDRAKKGQTDQLVLIINDRGGTATLDEILIDLFRKYKEIGARNIISNRLYRLNKQGLIRSIEGKKGIYTTA